MPIREALWQLESERVFLLPPAAQAGLALSAQADLLADARLLKVGKRLVVGEVSIFSQNSDEPVAHVTATYSIPAQTQLTKGAKLPFF